MLSFVLFSSYFLRLHNWFYVVRASVSIILTKTFVLLAELKFFDALLMSKRMHPVNCGHVLWNS